MSNLKMDIWAKNASNLYFKSGYVKVYLCEPIASQTNNRDCHLSVDNTRHVTQFLVIKLGINLMQ